MRKILSVICALTVCLCFAWTNNTTAATVAKTQAVVVQSCDIQLPDATQCCTQIGAVNSILGEKSDQQNFAAKQGSTSLYCLDRNVYMATAKDATGQLTNKTDCIDIGKSDQSNIVYFSPTDQIANQNNIAEAAKQTDNSFWNHVAVYRI